MNFISWNNKQVINEQTKNYLSSDLIEESIARTLKPVMNKMKKLNIGVPYRDSRIFFFKFFNFFIFFHYQIPKVIDILTKCFYYFPTM